MTRWQGLGDTEREGRSLEKSMGAENGLAPELGGTAVHICVISQGQSQPSPGQWPHILLPTCTHLLEQISRAV